MWLYLAVTILVLFYFHVKRKFSYFSSIGVPHEPGIFPFGSWTSWKVLMGKIPFAAGSDELYKKFPNAKVAGYYGAFGSKVFVINDMDLVKKVLVRDFDHFVDRRDFFTGFHDDIYTNKMLKGMLTALTGEKWKEFRTMITPMFTAGKLKGILPTIHEASKDFEEYLENLESKDDVDVKDLMQLCTCDILARVGCGVNANILKNPKDNLFYENLKILIGTGGTRQMMTLLVAMAFPWLSYNLKLSFLDAKATDFFCDMIKDNIQKRKESNVKMNDFIDHLAMIWKNKEFAIHGENDEESEFEKDAKISKQSQSTIESDEELENLIIAQGLVFFFAGNDTTSASLSIVCHFMAQHLDLQEKVYQEIQDAIDDNGGNQYLDYNKLTGLKTVEAFTKEALRHWKMAMIERLCTKDYHIPELNVTIPEGTLVQIASNGIMFEDRFYPDPQAFDPEGHFDGQTLIPSTFFLFGQGPRGCIGMRFAWIMMKALLVTVMSNYKILPGPGMKKELVIDPLNSSGLPKDGIHVKLEPRA